MGGLAGSPRGASFQFFPVQNVFCSIYIQKRPRPSSRGFSRASAARGRLQPPRHTAAAPQHRRQRPPRLLVGTCLVPPDSAGWHRVLAASSLLLLAPAPEAEVSVPPCPQLSPGTGAVPWELPWLWHQGAEQGGCNSCPCRYGVTQPHKSN